MSTHRPADDAHDAADFVEPGDIVIRTMGTGDVDSVAGIESSLYPNPWRREDFAELIDARGAFTWVAGAADGVVGYAVAWVVADEAELANLAVDAAWQRRGIGSRLVDVACRTARERGARTMWLDVRVSNTAARSLYARHGFRVVGVRRGYYVRPREDALVMALDLSNDASAVDPTSGAG